MDNNTDIIKQTIQSSDLLLGGELNAEQQTRFSLRMRNYDGLLNIVRFETLRQLRGTIDRMHIGSPITTYAEEDTLPIKQSKPQFDRLPILTKKMRSDWSVTRETMIQNIEQGNFENTLIDTMSERMKTDMEILGIQGDETTYAGTTDDMGLLLQANDGFDLLTEDCHIVDAGGQEISREMFAAASRSMPADQQNDPDLRWLINPNTLTDYIDLYGSRATPGGDKVNVEGVIERLLGRPVTTIALIPSSKDVSVTVATPAAVASDELDPWEITTGSNDQMLIDFDNAGATAITLSGGLMYAHEISAEINTAVGSNVSFADGYGRLVLQSATEGAASEIDIQAVANSPYALMGLTVAVTTGSAAGVAGTVPEGTYIWLMNPLNFVWVMTLQTALFSDFNKDRDRMEFTTFSFHDFVVEDKNRIVKLANVRRRQLM